jgi:adaptin ear-binding coat-associated protein 1/2
VYLIGCVFLGDGFPFVNAPAGRQAYIGLGFQQRSDAFDFNAALQDHAKPVEAIDYGPSEDLSLKAGETIRIKVPSVAKPVAAPAPAVGGGVGSGLKLGGLAPPTSAGRSKYSGTTGVAPAPAPAPAPTPGSRLGATEDNLLGL